MAFTFFFRDPKTLNAAVTTMVPVVLGRSSIRIWDAGCAAGEEAYTLAIMLAESLGPHAIRNLSIEATDHEESQFAQFEKIISLGEYHKSNVENVPAQLLEKYFVPAGRPGYFMVRDELKRRVSFTRHDLLSLVPPGGDYSLVVCKNVLLHFKPAQRVEVIKMFHKALLPGGYLALERSQELPPEVSGLFEQSCNGLQVFRKVEAP
jgi:chemotaxis protein methyltransferase CheR